MCMVFFSNEVFMSSPTTTDRRKQAMYDEWSRIYKPTYEQTQYAVALYRAHLDKVDHLTHTQQHYADGIVKNERETFYEQQQITELQQYYQVLSVIYYFLLVIWFAITLARPANRVTNLLWIVFFLIYPHIAYRLLRVIWWLARKAQEIAMHAYWAF